MQNGNSAKSNLVLDLLEVIGHEAANKPGYCSQPTNFKQYDTGVYYWDWEEKVAKPKLEALGYTSVVFSDGERDSFGPITRIVTAIKAGKAEIFIYG